MHRVVLMYTSGRFGNQLFQNWIAVWIADKLGAQVKVFNHHGDFIKLNKYVTYVPETVLVQQLRYEHIRLRAYTAEELDSVVRRLETPEEQWKNVLLTEQYGENAKFVFDHEAYIRQLYTPLFPPCNPQKRIAVHVRLDDLDHYYRTYVSRFCVVLSEKVFPAYPGYPVYLVTSHPDHPLLTFTQQLLASTVTVVQSSKDCTDDFVFLRDSAVIVSASSTFAWWAAFLGVAHLEKYYIFRDKLMDSAHQTAEMYDGVPYVEHIA